MKRLLLTARRHKYGFTLIEVVAMIAMVCCLVGIGALAYNTAVLIAEAEKTEAAATQVAELVQNDLDAFSDGSLQLTDLPSVVPDATSITITDGDTVVTCSAALWNADRNEGGGKTCVATAESPESAESAWLWVASSGLLLFIFLFWVLPLSAWKFR
jgi:Tfp pilus assembly protein PilE